MAVFLPTKRRSSALWLKVFVVIVCLAIVTLEGWRDWSERAGEFVRVETEMMNLAKSLAQHAEDTFNLADVILVDVVDRIEAGGASPAVITKMEGFLTERSQSLQFLKTLTIYGEDGVLLSSSLPGHRFKVNGQNQAFFQHHKASPSGQWFFGPLIRDPLGSDWVLSLSRRFNRPDGSFGGVVQISIPPRYFMNFFGRFDIGSQGSIALFDVSGTLLARFPYIENAIGTERTDGPWHSDQRAFGSYEYISPVDGISRLGAFQRNHVYPIVVLTAVGREQALARWNRDFRFRATGVASLVLIIGVLGWSLARALRRREMVEAELAVLATTDGLTGLANRRTFDRQLDTEWLRASRERKPLSLLLIDVDQFKAYNDIYGHQAGDECLQVVAQTLSKALCRSDDLVARYGGEELVVLLPDTDEAGAAAIAESIRARIEALALRHDANPPSHILTISIGSATLAATYESSHVGMKQLIALADSALYRAKQEGRNRVATAQAA